MIRRNPLMAMAGVTAAVILALSNCAAVDMYNLQNVKDIQGFQGSAEAKELLAKNGFVVADPSFKQIFQAYIESPETVEPSDQNPMGTHLPSFITTDSAWDTYHFLLEEGVKRMEVLQAHRLVNFSHSLLDAARGEKVGPELKLFVSVGLALQDPDYRKTVGPDETRIVDGLRNGTEPVDVPIGFELSPAQFRAQSFYAQSPELSDYFAARQWYGMVVFRLSNSQETGLALELSRIVSSNPELSNSWKQLSDPYDDFVARPEDETVFQYKHLRLPLVNDQLLSPDQYLRFGEVTRGFRLLPPRRLPDAVCFQNTVDPKIPNRAYPSGLDFMAASPVMHSPAAVRAVQKQFGKDVSSAILKTDCGPMPDSLYGQAMYLLAKLQEPMPAQAPAAMRSDAWGDLQLWSQLGAWAEQRHTWALHAKLTVEYLGMIEPPMGMVAPYPEFFAGLAKLTRQTATAFEKAGMGEQFDVQTEANQLLDDYKLDMRKQTEPFDSDNMPDELRQYYGFKTGLENQYYEKHGAEMRANGWQNLDSKVQDEIEELATRCTNGQASEADSKTLRMFFDCRDDIIRPLNNFAAVCDRLTDLARKALNREELTKDDAGWIENYGVTLAGLHFYGGNSYEVPEDNFPIVTRVFSNPMTGSMLYVGLARPQALYIIVPKGDCLQLYRGAVMTYREFVEPNSRLLDDDSWREMISRGQTPPAPPFTASFYAETSVDELLKNLQSQSQGQFNYGDLQDILWQIGARATEKDLPALFNMLTNAEGQEGGDIIEGISQTIGQLPWKPYEKQIRELLSSPDHNLANTAAQILIAQPNVIDPALLIDGFAQQPLHTRRLCCVILSALPRQSDATRDLFLQALRDPADAVRWQAALAIGKAGWSDARSQSALLETIKDTNAFVAAAAVHSLGRLGATNQAPILLKELERASQSAELPPADMESQSMAIEQDTPEERIRPDRLFNVDGVESQVETARTFHYGQTTALIKALGDLNYTPAYDELLFVAKNKQMNAQLREDALDALCCTSATNRVRDLIPLLDDPAPVGLPFLGHQWSIGDRGAEAIAVLLGWQRRMPAFFPPRQGDEEIISRVHNWAKQVH